VSNHSSFRTIEDYEKIELSAAGQEAQRQERERQELLARESTAISVDPVAFERSSSSAPREPREHIGEEDEMEVYDVSSDDEIQCIGTVTKPVNPHILRRPIATRPPTQDNAHKRASIPRRDYDDHSNIERNDKQEVLINLKGEKEVIVAHHLSDTLQPHQIAGVKFLWDNVIVNMEKFQPNGGLGCILAHSMGLGKTIQACGHCKAYTN
jgi:SNF2 family DNA or RNA helicase